MAGWKEGMYLQIEIYITCSIFMVPFQLNLGKLGSLSVLLLHLFEKRNYGPYKPRVFMGQIPFVSPNQHGQSSGGTSKQWLKALSSDLTFICVPLESTAVFTQSV